MHDFITDFKNLMGGDKIRTDNNVFRLHYRFSVILLIVFSILLSTKQYFGDPIHCHQTGAIMQEVLDSFCWAFGIFIIKNEVNPEYMRAYEVEGLGNAAGKEIYRLLFYQWICLLLCIQALLFYVPRHLWKTWEAGRLSQLVSDLCGPFIPELWTNSHKQKMIDYVLHGQNHNLFAYRFAFCEFLNLCNVIFQAIFINWYLQGNFLSYGYKVVNETWPKVHNEVFPKKAKCNYSSFGASGSLQNTDVLCILPLNVLNEKFFLIIWFWLIFLFVVTVGAFIYRLMVLTWRRFRVYLLLAQVRGLNRKKVIALANCLTPGQFFLIYNIGKNIHPVVYQELLLSVFDDLELKIQFN